MKSSSSEGVRSGLLRACWMLGGMLTLFLKPGLCLADTILGDLNGDSVTNVQDVALMVSHLQGIEFLSPEAIPLADVNSDGLLTRTDVEDLVRLILELEPLPEIELAKILSFSPANGEFDVSPTRETVVRFSMPLSEDTVLTNDHFYATFAGERLLTRVELSSDRLKATLFYLDYLPSGVRIRVTFDGSGLTDFLGRPISVNGNGSTTDLARADFETLSYAPVVNTGVIGTVFASEKDNNGNDVPLEGVIIEVVGDEERTRTTTDSNGEFVLEPVPAGRFFVNIDGRPITGGFPNNGYYPFIGKSWQAVAGIPDNLAGGTGTIYLPYIEPAALKTVSQVDETVIEFSEAVLESNPALLGTELIVPPNSLFSNDGSRGGRVGIAQVNPERLPEPLPPGLDLPLVITIQTDGATNFDVPVPVRLPNTPDPVTGKALAPGARSALWSFNHDIGEWEIAGPMRVTDDGRYLVTEPGVGVRQPGWHGQRPGTSGGGGGGDGDDDSDGDDDFTDLDDDDGDDLDGDDFSDLDTDTDLDADTDIDTDTDTDTDTDLDTDIDTDTDTDMDCTDSGEDCPDCEEGATVSASYSQSAPTGMLKKWENALNKIPRVTAKVGEVSGKVNGEAQDCCPDPKGSPISNGRKKLEVSSSLTGEVKGKIWGPPLIYFSADFKVVIAEVVIDAGVFINFNGSVGGAYGFERNACTDKNCAFYEFSGNLSIGLEASLEALAEACIGYGRWAACGDFELEAKPASIAAVFKGFIRADTCTGVTGNIGLDAIYFIAELKAYGVGVEYKYKIY